MEEVLIVAGLALASLVFVATVVVVTQRYEQARTQRIHTIADEMGLQFKLKGDPAVHSAVAHLRLFNRGRGRSFKNMLSGQTEDVHLALFEYRFVTGGGKNRRSHVQTVISFQSPQLQLPGFELRPENLFHRIGQAFGAQDINFDTHPRFSKRYVLQGPHESAIREVFSADMLEMLETKGGISIEAGGDLFVYYRAGQRIQPKDLRSFMDEGFQAYKSLRK